MSSVNHSEIHIKLLHSKVVDLIINPATKINWNNFQYKNHTIAMKHLKDRRRDNVMLYVMLEAWGRKCMLSTNVPWVTTASIQCGKDKWYGMVWLVSNTWRVIPWIFRFIYFTLILSQLLPFLMERLVKTPAIQVYHSLLYSSASTVLDCESCYNDWSSGLVSILIVEYIYRNSSVVLYLYIIKFDRETNLETWGFCCPPTMLLYTHKSSQLMSCCSITLLTNITGYLDFKCEPGHNWLNSRQLWYRLAWLSQTEMCWSVDLVLPS